MRRLSDALLFWLSDHRVSGEDEAGNRFVDDRRLRVRLFRNERDVRAVAWAKELPGPGVLVGLHVVVGHLAFREQAEFPSFNPAMSANGGQTGVECVAVETFSVVLLVLRLECFEELLK